MHKMTNKPKESKYSKPWARKLSWMLEQGVENPVAELRKQYSVPDKDIRDYLNLALALTKRINDEASKQD